MARTDLRASQHETDQGTPRFDRRVVLKAAAILAGMGGAAIRPSMGTPSVAHVSAESGTRGFDWYEQEQLGSVGGADATSPIVFETDFPYTAVGAHWPGDVGDWPIVQVQISPDGEHWSEPFTLTVSHDEAMPNRLGRRFTGLVCATGGRYIAYAVYDQSGNRVTVPGFALTYIDSSAGPTLDAVGGVGAASTDPSRPPRVIPRSEWGANESYRFEDYGEWWFPQYRTVRHAIVHHTETSNVEEPLQAIRAVYYYHAVTRGWHDIGYNFLVDRFGNIYQGRAGGQNVVGGHAYEYAQGSSGIAFMGNHNFADVSSSALAGMVAIVAWATRFLDPYGRSAFHGIASLPTICGHRDVLSTSCPGDLAYDDLARIRELVAQTLASQPGGPMAGFVAGDHVISDSDVNLRSGPSVSTSSLRLLDGGVRGVVCDGPVLADGYAWYQVATDYDTGWMAANFLSLDPPEGWKRGRFYNEQTVELIDSANFRRLPGVGATLISTLPAGTAATILGGPEEGDLNRWYKIRTAQGTGWIAARFLAPSGQAPPSSPPDGTFSVGDNVRVATDVLNVRSQPGTGSSILGTVTEGAAGVISDGPQTAAGITWYRLSGTNPAGWVAGQYLERTTSAPPLSARFGTGDRFEVHDGPVNLRNSPGTASAIITTLQTGATGTVQGGPSTASGYTWYQISTSAGTGWVADDFIRAATASSGDFVIGQRVSVSSGPLNVRAAAGTGSAVLVQLATGTGGTIVAGPTAASGYTWYQIETSQGTGWVAQDFLTSASSAPPPSAAGFNPGDTVVVADGPLNLRSSAGTSGAIVAVLAQDARAAVLDGPTSSGGNQWYRVQSGGQSGWVAGSFLAHAPRTGLVVRVATGNGSVNLRTGAGLSAGVIATIPDNTTGTVVGGPQSAEGYTWWRIQTASGTGWSAGAFLTLA
jgi:uncharacterized protein YgiM (DUF1202 family)